MKYFFTADLHLGHANIIKYCKRPFKNVDHMNETLISNWNNRVSDEDQVFHVGDFCFKNSAGGKDGEGMVIKASTWEEQLNGTKIKIKGNHDKNNSVKSIIESIIIKYGNHYVNLVHKPEHYNSNYSINFVGHIHNKWKFKREYNEENDTTVDLINVGVDVWNFRPVTFEEIYTVYKKWLKGLYTKEDN